MFYPYSKRIIDFPMGDDTSLLGGLVLVNPVAYILHGLTIIIPNIL